MSKIDYTRHYRHWHSDSENHIKQMTDFYRKRIIPKFQVNKDAKILDIGCGMGFLLLALKADSFSNIKGIDIDAGQVASCQAKGLDVELVADSIEYLKANPGKFDLITAFDVLEHIPPEFQIDFVEAIHTALVSGGSFMGSVPNASSVLGNRNRYIDYTHWVTFTEISLDFVLFNGGFKKIEVLEMDFVFFSLRPFKFLHWLLFKKVRFLRRMTFIAELGIQQGKSVPLSFNLIGRATKD